MRDGDPKQIVGLYQKLLYARPEQRDEIRARIMADVDSCDLNHEIDSSIDPSLLMKNSLMIVLVMTHLIIPI